MSQLKVYVGRTNVVPFDLNMDVTGDTLAAQIRTEADPSSTLIATWTVAVTDEATGVGTLTLDNSTSAAITQTHGYTDILRTTGGEPVSVFDEPLSVRFVKMPTAAA